MNIEDLEFAKDDFGLLIPTSKIFVPILNLEIEIWFDIDFEQQLKPTAKQWQAFQIFLSLDNSQTQQFDIRLTNYRNELTEHKRLTRSIAKQQSFQKLDFSSIIIPRQTETNDTYLILLADTDWRILSSEFVIELEILFKNNKFELLQEMTGLWTRSEWDDFYNIKKDVA